MTSPCCPSRVGTRPQLFAMQSMPMLLICHEAEFRSSNGADIRSGLSGPRTLARMASTYSFRQNRLAKYGRRYHPRALYPLGRMLSTYCESRLEYPGTASTWMKQMSCWKRDWMKPSALQRDATSARKSSHEFTGADTSQKDCPA